MPGKMALVDYGKCRPERCDSGICAAVLACSPKLLKQEAPYEIPMTDPFLCRGGGDCVRACLLTTSDDIAVKVGTALQRQGIRIIGRLHFDTGLFESSVEGKVLAEGKVLEDIQGVLDVVLADGTRVTD